MTYHSSIVFCAFGDSVPAAGSAVIQLAGDLRLDNGGEGAAAGMQTLGGLVKYADDVLPN